MVKISPIVWTNINRLNSVSKKPVSNTSSVQKSGKLGFGNNISFAATNPITTDTFTSSVPTEIAAAKIDAKQTLNEAKNIIGNAKQIYEPVSTEINTFVQNVITKAEDVKGEVERLYTENSEVPENIKIKNIATGVSVMKEYSDDGSLSRKSCFTDGKLSYTEEIVKQEPDSPISKNIFVFGNDKLAQYSEDFRHNDSVEKIGKLVIFNEGKLSEYQEDVEIADKTKKMSKSISFIDGQMSVYREGCEVSKKGKKAEKRIKFIDGKPYRYEEGYEKSSDGVRKTAKRIDFDFSDNSIEYIEGSELSSEGRKIAKVLECVGVGQGKNASYQIKSYQEDFSFLNGVFKHGKMLDYKDGKLVGYISGYEHYPSSAAKCDKSYRLENGKWIDKTGI